MALTRVKYKGLSDVREMSQEDLFGAGVSLSAGLVWDDSNKVNGILIEDPSERLLEIFTQEGTFTVTEVNEDDNTDGEEIVTGKPLDDTGNTVIDTTANRASTPEGDKEVSPAESQQAVDTGPVTTKAAGNTGKGKSA
jgi:hypothetical protein